ncbi:MAG: o-succinylbenzoate synthase [Bacteroidia bacterium]|jgi:o-succinylbenzoate synthase
MAIKASYIRRELQFKKPSRTSRATLHAHTAFYIFLKEEDKTGIGEASPLKGLSIDDNSEFESVLKEFCDQLSQGRRIKDIDLESFPAMRFGFETAERSLRSLRPYYLYDTPFTQGKGIAINGLVWMDDKEKMLLEARSKWEQGYQVLKFKVGALDFDEECRMLETVRNWHGGQGIEIRLDANGAFSEDDVFEKLKELSRFRIHSLEQPVRAGQYEFMHEVCVKSKIDIALDEELIGVQGAKNQLNMLKQIKPVYLILKPTLLGGIQACDQWIKWAQQLGMGWWATSALESNIGLNAIAQWVSTYPLNLPQGLGTGGLFVNNINSSLNIQQGKLFWGLETQWDLPEMIPPHE